MRDKQWGYGTGDNKVGGGREWRRGKGGEARGRCGRGLREKS